VIDCIESQAGPNYLIKSFDQMAETELSFEGSGEGKDDLYSQAYQIITETGILHPPFSSAISELIASREK